MFNCISANTEETPIILCNYLFLSFGLFLSLSYPFYLILTHLVISIILQKQLMNIYFLLISLQKKKMLMSDQHVFGFAVFVGGERPPGLYPLGLISSSAASFLNSI